MTWLHWLAEALKHHPWVWETLKYIGSGILGAGLAFGLTWRRERRRSLDSYRAPQREAIGEILAATHAFMLSELRMRTQMNEMVEQIRQLAQQQNDVDVPGDQLVTAMKAMGEKLMTVMDLMGVARLDLDRAFAIGRLTIVDPPCFEAMGRAYFRLEELRSALACQTEVTTIDEVQQYIRIITDRSTQLNSSVSAMVVAAIDRVSPAETLFNPRRRRRARTRLGEFYRQLNAVEASAARSATSNVYEKP